MWADNLNQDAMDVIKKYYTEDQVTIGMGD